MSTKLRQDGRIINHTSVGVQTANSLIKIGDTFGVVLKSSTASGQKIAVAIEGVWELPKIAAASTNLVVGQLVYARATGSTFKVLGVATGNAMGTAFAIAATGGTTAEVKLHGFATN